MTILVKCDGAAMVEVSESDLYALRMLYPELVCTILDDNGDDITAEYLAAMRTKLIYG